MTFPARPRPGCLSICLSLILSYSLPAAGQLNVNFTSDKSGGCSPLVIHFSSQTTGASASATYLWDFGNGNTSTLTNPQAVYIDEGIHTVTLTVKDGAGSGVATHSITVYQPPTADLSASQQLKCLPAPVTFASSSTAGSGSISGYLWDFGDGVTLQGAASESHTYQHPGNPQVSLTVTNSYGCSHYIEKAGLIKILPSLTAAFTSDKKVLCNVSDPVQFTNSSTGPGTLSYLWDFGDGHTSSQASPSWSYAQKGTYPVRLTVTSSEGCSATVTEGNYLNVANYTADFDVPGALCQGDQMSFNDKSIPVPDSRVWQVDGAGAGTAATLATSFAGSGIHTIKLTGMFGACMQSVTKQVTVNPSPVIPPFDIDIQGKCGAPVNVEFTDHTPGAVAWDWNFRYIPGDNFPDIVHQGPSASTQGFANFQPYTVQLKVTNANGCTSTTSQPVTVTRPAVYIDELNSPGESSCGIPITKTYEIQHPELLQSWSWDFGDGATSTELSPTHTFTGVGQYITLLTYVSKDGCTGTANQLYTIIAAPLHIDFDIPSTTVCAGQHLLFNSPSVYTSDAIWATWSFGDGTESIWAATHTYTTPGVYTVSLRAENAGGCFVMVTKTNYLTVLAPVGEFTGHTNTCDDTRDEVTFHFTPGSATSLVWDFGDGKTATTDGTVSQVKHVYADNGIYQMSVTGGTATCAISSSEEVEVFKKQYPVLSGDKTIICPDGVVALEVSNYDINSWTGIQSNNYNLQFQYGDSTDFQGSITSEWQSWGNAFMGQLSNFQGTKSGLRLITTSIHFGCNDTTNIIPLTIQGANAGYEIVAGNQCFTSPVVLKDTSKVTAGNSIISWLWDFGDGQTSQQSGTVSHNYAEPGTYAVKLTVKDASGCNAASAPAVAQVKVNGPKAAFSPSASNVPLNTNVSFSNTTNSFGSNPIWAWDFGDHTTSGDPSPSHIYTQPGTFTVTLKATDPVTGCSSIVTATIVVDPFGSSFEAAASYVSLSHCPPMLVQFTNHSVNYTGEHWDFGDGTTADDIDAPSHVYEKAGKYTITLTVSGANGMSAQYTQDIVVTQPVATLSADAPAICAGQPAKLRSAATSAVEYLWDFGDGSIGSGSEPAITHTYGGGGTYQLKLLVTDPDGCTAAADAGLTQQVHPPPAARITSSQSFVCLDGSIPLKASGGSTYSWQPSLGLDHTDVSTPLASPQVSTNYQVTVTDDIGCSNTANIAIEVVQPLSVTVTPGSAAVCPGQSISLQAAGAASYSWIYNVSGLSNTQTSNPVARPLASGTYTVTGTDAHTCFTDTAEVKITLLPVPTVNAGPDEEVLSNNPITLMATASDDVTKWTWSPTQFLNCADCAQPECTPRQTMQYVATVKNGDGCTASDTVIVKLACDAARVGIANTFSPNGDGHNDRLVIQGIGEVSHLVIYDRWGDKVFERSHFNPADPSSCWDGTLKGRPVPTGVYVYLAEMQCPTGGVFTMKGTVMLVR